MENENQLTENLDSPIEETHSEEEARPAIEVRKSPVPLYIEIILDVIISAVAALLCVALYKADIFSFAGDGVLELTYSKDLTLSFSSKALVSSSILSLIDVVVILGIVLLLRPSGLSPKVIKTSNIVSLILLSVCGMAAYIVLTVLLTGFSFTTGISLFAAGFIVNLYEILIYKMYLEERTYSNFILWEIFRFVIVGLVAAVFDFAVCYLLQFIAFAGNESWYVTVISTAGGFVVGVTINYLMSTFMVYKATKSNVSRTFKGIVIFLVLAVIGLLIGVGIQYFLYDYLYLTVGVSLFSYPIDFVIRTLIVMVYNYITRKLILYR